MFVMFLYLNNMFSLIVKAMQPQKSKTKMKIISYLCNCKY